MAELRGNISTEHTVWCCRARRISAGLPFEAKSTVGHPYGCESHYSASGTTREVAAEARSGGWIQTREFGWLCGPCAAAYQEWRQQQKAARNAGQ